MNCNDKRRDQAMRWDGKYTDAKSSTFYVPHDHRQFFEWCFRCVKDSEGTER